jgi:hypothetical protein
MSIGKKKIISYVSPCFEVLYSTTGQDQNEVNHQKQNGREDLRH